MKKSKILNLLYIYILIQPFIDLATSLVIRFTEFPITLGICIRGLFILIVFGYILFYSKSKYKKVSLLYISLIGLYILGYIFTKEGIFKLEFLIEEVLSIFKYLYVPIIFLGLLNIFDDYKLNYKKMHNIFISVVMIYSILIILAIITNSSFSSYTVGDNAGFIGWFYSANEIGAILTILYPYLFFYIMNKRTYPSGLILLPTTFVMIFIGTKTSLLGLVIPLLLFSMYIVWNKICTYKKPLIITTFFLLIVIACMTSMPAIENAKANLNRNNNDTTTLVFSNRNQYLVNIAEIYIETDVDDQLFGVGFTNRNEINDPSIIKIIEMDIHDILFRFGFIGMFIMFLPYIYIFYVIIKYIESKKKLGINQLIYGYCVGITLVVAFIAGHVLGAPAVAIYLAISMIMLIDTMKCSEVKMKKVLFISSTGGHLSELLQLKPMFEKYDYHLITEKTKSNLSLPDKFDGKVNFLIYGTKDFPFKYIFKFLGNCFKSLYLYFKIRPKYIVTTGTHTAVPMCYIGKLFGSKIIFIETFANSETKTLSGKMVYPISDLFIVQWENMLNLYPKAVLGGWIY